MPEQADDDRKWDRQEGKGCQNGAQKRFQKVLVKNVSENDRHQVRRGPSGATTCRHFVAADASIVDNTIHGEIILLTVGPHSFIVQRCVCTCSLGSDNMPHKA